MSHPDQPQVAGKPADAFFDGCELDFTADPTPDEDIDGLILFADVDPADAAAVESRRAAWIALGALEAG